MIGPAFSENSVTLVCSSDNNYVPYLVVLLYSIVDHISCDNNYDILILEDSISNENKTIIMNVALKRKNVSIRFIDMVKYTNGVDQRWSIPDEKKWSRAIYYRMLIPYILSNFEKVVYLDCDIINFCDIAELYKIELENNLIGAVRLLGMVNIGQCNMFNSTYILTDCTLPQIKIEDYFNSGVLIINIQRFLEAYSKEYILEFINIQNYGLPDQESLNVLCANQVKYIDAGWNCYPYTKRELENVLEICPKDKKEYYREGYSHIKNVHYTTPVKPWMEPYGEYANSSSFFWKYAIGTPYVSLLYTKMQNYLKIKEKSIYIIKRTWTELQNFSNHNKLILYGYGVRGKEFRELYGAKIKIAGVCDRDERKKSEITDIPFIDLQKIKSKMGEEIGILISNDDWERIADRLTEQGYDNLFSYKCLSLRETLAWYLHPEDFLKAEYAGSIFEDDKSKNIYWEIIQKREQRMKDRNLRYIDIYEGDSYFRDDIYQISDEEIYVDIGSYKGTTVQKFIEYAGKYNKIYAFEMDEESYESLVRNCKYPNVIAYNVALCDRNARQNYNHNSVNSAVEYNGMYSVEGYCLDTILPDEKITFIKINVNNVQNVIRGGVNTIKKNKPKLAICLSNNYADLWEIPIAIKKIEPSYRIYLRHHSEDSSLTVLYAR